MPPVETHQSPPDTGKSGAVKAISLQKQLLVRLAGVLTTLWLLGLLLAGTVLQQTLNQSFDSALQETAERILPLAVVETYNREQVQTENPGQQLQQLPALRAHEEYLTYRVQNAGGQVLIHSHAAQKNAFIRDTPLTEGFTEHQGYRLYITSAVSGHFFIQVAEPLAQREAAVRRSLFALALPFLIILPLGLFMAAWLIRTTLRPVNNYGKALEKRGVSDLSPIENLPLPQELTPVVRATNQLMRRLQKALEAERNFTSNAAHELRTPLATVMAQLQRLQKKLHEPDALYRAEQMANSLKHLSDMSEKLLQLAQAEGAGLQCGTPFNVCDYLPLLIHHGQSCTAPLQLELPSSAVMTRVDMDALALLINNLLENAIKHGLPEQPVRVSLDSQGVLAVINACPALPEQQLLHLRERFYRGNTQTAGSGLGLAIATTLAEGMGSQLQIFSPACGDTQGFEVRVQLPL